MSVDKELKERMKRIPEMYEKNKRWSNLKAQMKSTKRLETEMSEGEQDLWIHRNPKWGIKSKIRRRLK